MVKDASSRNESYGSKIDADVTRARIAARRDSMITRQGVASTQAVDTENAVKAVIEAAGVKSWQFGAYHALGKQLLAIKNKFSGRTTGTTGGDRANTLCQRWQSEGLLFSVINDIAHALEFPDVALTS